MLGQCHERNPRTHLRDVLQQIDRRLTLIEEDLRQVDGKVDTQGESLRNDHASLRLEVKSDIASFRREVESRFLGIDTKFRWLTGIVLLSWLSLMTTILLSVPA